MMNHFKMIKRYKNISLQKISDHGGEGNTPTHSLVVKDENFKNKQGVGKLWTKTSDYGKYLAGQMEKDREYIKDAKTVKVFGYSIVKDSDLDELEAMAGLRIKEPEVSDEEKEKERLSKITIDPDGNHSDIPF